MSVNSRVCDRCIRKKVKCEEHIYHCARGHLTYRFAQVICSVHTALAALKQASHARIRPKGEGLVHHAGLDNGSSGSGSMPTQSPPGDPMLDRNLASGGTHQQALQDFTELSVEFSPYGSMTAPSDGQFGHTGYYLEPGQERDILVHFFDEVHAAIPLFHESSFIRLYDNGLACRDLIVTIVTVTAKILGPINYWKTEDVHLCMGALLKATASENDSSSTQATLDRFRQECLLAYYEFHQFPGPPSWMRVSRLTRKAYAVGLHQVENPELCSAFDAALTDQDEIEDWRYVWWCVFCLDSYSNISSGAPFIVELESINTALVRRPNCNDTAALASTPKVLLPEEVDHLWKTTQDVVSGGCMNDFNIHMITTTILRQAGNLLRLRSEGKRLPTRNAALKGTLATLRLALPPRYLNPARNVLRAERSADHHTRLTNILHLQMVRLITSMPQGLEANEAEWMDNWQQTLETCQDIVSVVEHWNSQFSPRVDPAICFITFSALRLLNGHRRCITDPNSPLLASLSQGENVLLLFIEQFSSMWAAPKVLIQQFRDAPTSTPLTYADIDRLLSNFKSPLHPKSLQPSALSLNSAEIYESLDSTMNFADVWSFNPFDSGV
ncbi:Uu.00g076240.m01.CDS01 [Anthostomella pinea]|uniref:Uu.00g076240.m01.CDS01 n=1 Tax=Anthostomella pinea TaxID=933095 RepID=A0AAI8VWJ5_9PEZI|nr:Uu.00g076240.m01.CDS01 [Anthostomella pinea]